MSKECANQSIKDAVCIHTDKVYDACKDKDCIVDARVYVTPCGQEIIDRSINIKVRKAEIIWVYTDVELSMYKKICLNLYIALPKLVQKSM